MYRSRFDHIYLSHLLEHFSHREVKNVLVEWVRVLKTGGTLEIRCLGPRARAQDSPENTHKCGFSFKLLKGLLEFVGIKDVKRIIKSYKVSLSFQVADA